MINSLSLWRLRHSEKMNGYATLTMGAGGSRQPIDRPRQGAVAPVWHEVNSQQKESIMASTLAGFVGSTSCRQQQTKYGLRPVTNLANRGARQGHEAGAMELCEGLWHTSGQEGRHRAGGRGENLRAHPLRQAGRTRGTQPVRPPAATTGIGDMSRWGRRAEAFLFFFVP